MTAGTGPAPKETAEIRTPVDPRFLYCTGASLGSRPAEMLPCPPGGLEKRTGADMPVIPDVNREISRRDFTKRSAGAAAFVAASGLADVGAAAAPPERPANGRPGNRIAVSTYSFWQFRHEDLRDVERCIDLAAEWGFDGVEILHRQMTDETPAYLQ